MPQRFAIGFDPETVNAMMAAFDKACDALRLAKTHDGATEFLAKAVVEQAKTGERDPDKLCAMTLRALNGGG
ncbi:MAG TPA: hypothetical protein VLV76_11870 [Candidatus Acidoferrum sp.]|nr:hypothetical protein [Candidatus Acidoferrum sp.]